MSTLVGHSDLQALHDRHRSSDCLDLLVVPAAAHDLAPQRSDSMCARPRVLCSSSSVTM